jgi:hypothetical protein
MTLEEALAVSRTAPIELVITSDAYALQFLLLGAKLAQRPPCIAVSGPDAPSEQLLEAGATVVADRDPRQILAAVSELTGLAFRMHPRAKMETIVDVTFGSHNLYLSTIDISISGVALSGFPEAGYGDRAQLRFDMFDPPVSAEAMVVRMFDREGTRCAGLCFIDMSAEDRSRLRVMIERERSEPFVEPMARRPSDDTRELLALLSQETDRGLSEYMRLISERVLGCAERTPGWLNDLAQELTPTERSSLADGERS